MTPTYANVRVAAAVAALPSARNQRMFLHKASTYERQHIIL
jgi:hypothetical protein